MSMSEPLEAHVLVDAELPAGQERLLVDVFDQLGVIAHTRVVPPRRGVAELNWLVLASLPLQAFLGTVGTKFADDAYRQLKALLGRLVHGDRFTPGGQRPMVLRDDDTGLELVLEPDLPDEGYRHQRRWRSERDEAR
jgi:hypothetical protein